MKRWTVLLLPLVVACTDPTAPAVRCEGALVVHITITPLVTDTAVVCTFPVDSTPPTPPPPGGHHHHHDHDDDHGGHR
jgi:hypothetical protein